MGEAPLAAWFHLAAGRRTVLVNGAAHAASETSAKGDAAAILVEFQVRLTVAVVHDEASHEVRMGEKCVPGEHLDVVDEPLGSVFVGVRAAGAAARAVERFGTTWHPAT